MKLSVVLCGFLLAAGPGILSPVSADSLSSAWTSGSRVNVRIKPDINSEVVTQLEQGEEVRILKKDDEWTEIAAPYHTRCWIHNSCLTEDTVSKGKVNLRCGPGMAYPVLTQLPRGTAITVVKTFGDWTRVKPPAEFGVWVSTRYLDDQEPAGEKAIEEEITVSEEDMIKIEPVLPVTEAEPKIISISDQEIAGVKLVSYAGRLEDLGMIINRPGTYKLISPEGSGQWLCIITSEALNINPFINRIVRLEGVIISESTSWGVPVIDVKRLCVIK